MTESAAPVRLVEETSAYWRVLFDYPPFNILDATIFEGLQGLPGLSFAGPMSAKTWSSSWKGGFDWKGGG